MSRERRSASSGKDLSSKSAGSRTSISVKLPEALPLGDQLAADSPVQIRALSPSRTPRHEYIVEHRKATASPHSSGTLAPQGTPTRTMLSDKEVQQIIAARIIERCWLSYRDRQMFKLLKHAICAAEHSLSYEILRKVNPKEAELFKDKCMQAKIRFRFGGSEFPPMIFFKVFTRNNSDGCGVKYVSGKRMILPATEAARDACERMGHRKFYEQILHDMMQQREHKIADEVDVTTLKDYMQYLSVLDETPSYLGGRSNSWRKLTLESLPRWTIFHDIVGFLNTQHMSPHLKEKLPTLLLQPTNEELLLQHIRILSEFRAPDPPPPNILVKTGQNETSRRSQQARTRAAKLKRAYTEKKTDSNITSDGNEKGESFDVKSGVITSEGYPWNGAHPNGDVYNAEAVQDGWEEEADNLYEWTQQLSFEEITNTPRINSAFDTMIH